MKKFALLGIILFVVVQLSCASGNRERIHGNKQIITKEIDVDVFTGVSTNIEGLINIHIAPTHKVLLSCDDNLAHYLDISVSNGILRINMRNGNRFIFSNLVIDVYASNINRVDLAGIGTVRGIIEGDDFRSGLTGTGTIELSGNSRTARISVTGTGRFLGSELKTNEARASVNGTGRIEIWAVDKLDANITGTGRIRYKGRPQITFSGSGTGRIEAID